MKLCYVLPQYKTTSSENFFHIPNFLNELGKRFELYLIIEYFEGEVVDVPTAKKIFIIQDNVRLNIFKRTLKLLGVFLSLIKKGIKIFFVRSSLTGSLPLALANRIYLGVNARIIFWSCGQDIVKISYFPTRRNIKRIFSKVLNRLVFLLVDYVATGPEKMADYYSSRFKLDKDKILLFHNDISLDRFKFAKNSDRVTNKKSLFNTSQKTILFVHTISFARGADILIPISKYIVKNKKNVKIVVIGRQGNLTDKMEEISKNINYKNNFLFLGEISNADIVKYYQASDLFIMPSRGEGFPRVLLESMSTGCPVLSYDVGGVSQILPKKIHDEFLITLNDEEGFIKKIFQIINNDKLLDYAREINYIEVKKYETSNIADMYAKTINNLL